VIRTTFQTDEVRAGDRLDYWRDLMCRARAPMEVRSADADDFCARQSMLELGAVHVWDVACLPSQMRRTPVPIRRSDPDMVCAVVTLEGTLSVSTAGRDTTCTARELSLHDTSHPVEMEFRGPDARRPYRGLAVMVPRAMLTVPGLDRVLGLQMPAHRGIGALLSDSLVRLTSEPGSYRLDDGPRLGLVLIDMVSAVVGNALDAGRHRAPEARRQVLGVRIRAFIQRNLPDPHLTPPTIAAAHHISTSYLHRIFQMYDTTVSAWIRQQRLERARRDLADPATLSTPIHRIAARWGGSPTPQTSPAPSAPPTASHRPTTAKATRTGSRERRRGWGEDRWPRPTREPLPRELLSRSACRNRTSCSR
jgi:AraC-like DNA-binding protein